MIIVTQCPGSSVEVEHILGKDEVMSSMLIPGPIKKGIRNAKSKRKKSTLTIVGKTVDGKFVVQGLFPLMSSILGLPLDILLEDLKNNNMVVDWIEFYESSKKHGWKDKTILNRISEGATKIYGENISEQIIRKLKFYLKTKKNQFYS